MGDLPPYPTPFVGRQDELAHIRALLSDPACHLLTLVGPGGIGKTRLVLEAARQQMYTDGVHFVSLQPIASSDYMVSTIADAVHLRFYPGVEPKQQLLDYFSEKSLLLVLDNLEQLLDDMTLLADILAAAPRVRILATSRERLNLREEWVLEVGGLSYPADAAEAALESYSAVTLFAQHARRVKASFRLSDRQRAAVVRICQLVSGMPLGIELAASWVRALSCEAIADEIERSLDILETPARNVEPRHRTMRAALDPTWARLTEEERNVFMRLSVFRGGFTREAAEVITGATLRTLRGLVDKSLVRVDANGRYDLHELLRQYAQDRLDASGVQEETRQRQADYFLAVAERTEAKFKLDPAYWMKTLEAELANFRLALARSKTGLRLAIALREFWLRGGHVREGTDWLRYGLVQTSAACETKADRALRAIALDRLGLHSLWQGDRSAALQHHEESLALYRELGDRVGIADELGRLGGLFLALDEFERASVLLDESLVLHREIGEPSGIAWVLAQIGWVKYRSGDEYSASVHWEQSLALFRSGSGFWGEASVLINLAMIALDHGDYRRAKRHLSESVTLYQQWGERWQIFRALDLFACLSVVEGEATGDRLTSSIRAARISGAVEALRESFGAPITLFPDCLCAQINLRAQLDEATFATAWAEGRAMTLDQIITYVLQPPSSPEMPCSEPAQHPPALPRPLRHQTLADNLTEREMEILRLIADGRTNREIADQLVLAVGTIKWYVNQIFSKLDVTSRTQAVARARTLGLVR